MQLAESSPAGLDVLEQPDFPEFLAQQLVERVAQQVAQERVRVDNLAGVAIEDQDRILGRLKEPAVANLGSPQCDFRPPALGDVLDGEQDVIGMLGLWREASGVEHHGLSTESRERVFNLKVVDRVVAGKDFIQQRPQAGDVPLAVAQVVHEVWWTPLSRPKKCRP